MDTTDNKAFYDWLQNRNKVQEQARPQERARLELPKPPMYRNPEPKVVRGVCIIEFF